MTHIMQSSFHEFFSLTRFEWGGVRRSLEISTIFLTLPLSDYNQECNSPELCKTTLGLFHPDIPINHVLLDIKVAVFVILEKLRNFILLPLAKSFLDLCTRSCIFSSHSHAIPFPSHHPGQAGHPHGGHSQHAGQG